MNRRRFLESALAASVSRKLTGQGQYPWGGPVLDIHLHLRQNPDSNVDHVDGAGVTKAVLLTPAAAVERAQGLMAKHPGRFVIFTSTNVAQPGAVETLKKTAAAGTKGFGELKTADVAVDGPEMRRIYDLAAELRIPVLIHFQDYPSRPGGNDVFNTGISRFPAVLKAYPRTTFIGHANSFWANISADVPPVSYPSGRIKPGGLTDRMLSDYPNLYGDLSANSGRNALGRDSEFAAGFLKRHQDKLMLGSDCPCLDGHGKGQVSQEAWISGKCVARETLTSLKSLASPEVFRKITWENGTKLLNIPA
jgi:predicted TIM-barrel fold metal-dependent hydrolase